DALKDSDEISQLRFSTIDLEQEEFSFTNVFNSIKYKKGNFLFKWNSEFLPHILELKDKFVLTDLAITSKFKSGFTWTLYDYLKAHYGHWSKELSKEGLMRLFSVENRKTYQRSTAQLKRGVLDVAIEEINKYTELEAWYTQIKTGNKITGFKLHWSNGKTIAAATDKQINLLRKIHEEVDKNQLSKTLEIPETTTRRYLNTFDEYFRWEQIGRGKKYDPDSVEILQRIAMLYSADRETFEIKKILADEYAFTIDEENNGAATND